MQTLVQQGLMAGQQATQLEAMGNAMGAAQCYDMASQAIGNAIAQATMSGFPVGDQVFSWAAQAQFGAARAKSALGLLPIAMAHLQQALFAANQAVMRNPAFAPNHALAGMILAAMGNLPEAMRALGQAVAMNPADQMSRAMLAQLSGVMPAMAMPMPMPNPVQMPGGAMPGGAMPGMFAGQAQGWGGPDTGYAPAAPAGGPDRMKTIGNFLSLAITTMKTLQQAEQTFNFSL